jgi:SAM-dependent methyltransferase
MSPAAKTSSVTFPSWRLDTLGEVETGHFWHAPRRRLLLDTIERSSLAPGARLLDVGCGTGTLVMAMLGRGFDAHGIDAFAERSGLDPTRFRSGHIEALPDPDASAAAVCAFDVLEHVDDGRALAELHRVLVPGGHLFVSVPAYGWLWSTRDAMAGHRRRYTRRMLRQRLQAAGFVLERMFGYQFLLLPLLAVARFRAKWRRDRDTEMEDRPGALINSMLLAVNRLEVWAGRWKRPPFGSSLVLMARKPCVRK